MQDTLQMLLLQQHTHKSESCRVAASSRMDDLPADSHNELWSIPNHESHAHRACGCRPTRQPGGSANYDRPTAPCAGWGPQARSGALIEPKSFIGRSHRRQMNLWVSIRSNLPWPSLAWWHSNRRKKPTGSRLNLVAGWSPHTSPNSAGVSPFWQRKKHAPRPMGFCFLRVPFCTSVSMETKRKAAELPFPPCFETYPHSKQCLHSAARWTP